MTGEGAAGGGTAQLRRLAVPGAVLALLAVAFAAAGSPGSLHVGDPAWWVVAAVTLAALVVLGWAALVLLVRHQSQRARPERVPIDYRVMAVTLLLLVAAVGISWALSLLVHGGGKVVLPPPPHQVSRPPSPPPNIAEQSGGHSSLGPIGVLIIGILILVGLTWVAVQRLRSRRTTAPVEIAPGDPLVAAIEAALIDLEGELDPRRAVIKAYARTEAVLRAHGLPRRPSEAPLEYLDRVLRDLGARAGAVDRLTVLFERAAFSQHEVGPQMRDEAVAAFHGLRDDLAAAAEETP